MKKLLLTIALLLSSAAMMDISAGCRTGGCSRGCTTVELPCEPAPDCCIWKKVRVPARKFRECKSWYECPANCVVDECPNQTTFVGNPDFSK